MRRASCSLWCLAIDRDTASTNVKSHKVLADYERALVGLTCLVDDLTYAGCRYCGGAELRDMRIDRKLRMSPCEYRAGLAWRGMDRQYFLKRWLLKELLLNRKHLM